MGREVIGTFKKERTWVSVWSVQLLSPIQLFVTPWTAARQASLSITNSWSLLKLMSIELVMPSNYLILCRPLLLPSLFPSIRVFPNESVLRIRWPKYWNFGFSIRPSTEYSVICSNMTSSPSPSVLMLSFFQTSLAFIIQ